MAASRAGEGAGLVTEQFGFEDFPGQRGAVQFHQRTGAALAAVMQDTGGQAFAGAGFARNDDGAERHVVQACQHVADLLGRWALAKEGFRRVAAVAGLGLFQQTPLRQGRTGGAGHDQVQPVHLAGLFEKLVGAQPQGPHRFGHAAIAGEEDPLAVRQLAPDLLHQVQRIAVRQIHVGKNDQGLKLLVLQQPPRLGQVVRPFHVPAGRAVMAAQLVAQQGFVLDDQQGLGHGVMDGLNIGSTRKCAFCHAGNALGRIPVDQDITRPDWRLLAHRGCENFSRPLHGNLVLC